MKKVLFTLIFGILICSCSSTKKGKNNTKFFDENNLEISKSKFNRIRTTNKLFVITGDSIHHKKLSLRKKEGKINDKKVLELLFEKELNQKLDPNKPIVIIYYPGKDSCNRSGTRNKESIQMWYLQLEEGIHAIAQVKPIYIYKDSDGLKEYDGILEWKKDPEGIVERLFFDNHYPCSSFVVISKNGEYLSYFGEFPKEIVWEATQLMNN